MSTATTDAIGEEGPYPTTSLIGEEQPYPSTDALGEECPTTYTGEDPSPASVSRVDKPFGSF